MLAVARLQKWPDDETIQYKRNKDEGGSNPNLCVRRQRQYCCATFSYVNRPALL
uniref:Uncharacterized protein n=1 Tax=Anguilla anguilla TaxID=7936 RepID=A0A0E9U702_ANGAN